MFDFKDEMIWLLVGLLTIAGVVFHVENAVSEERIKIGIIDSGISINQSKSKILCQDGLKSTIYGDLGYDRNGHGTNIFSLVSKDLDHNKYCIISYKVWKSGLDDRQVILYSNKSLQQAIKDKVKFLNISMSGAGGDSTELNLIKQATQIMKIVVAAGNDGKKLGKRCDVYPACYRKYITKNLYVIGNYNNEYSNYGEYVDYFTHGVEIGIPKRTGTSQSAAFFTNKLIKKKYKNVVYINRSLNVRFNFFRTTTGK